jgi:energy-coupling factor transport system permease protein
MTLAESMDARGHGRGRRSRYRPQPWTSAGVATALIGPGAACVFVGASARGLGDLHPSTDPLEWPLVSSVLVITIVALALPGMFRRSAS